MTRVGEAAGVAAYVGDVLSTPSAGGSSKKREREDRGGMGGGMGESGGSSASPRSVGDVYEIMLGIGSGGGERGSEGRGVEGEEVAEQAGSGEERPVVALGAGVGSDSESDDSSGVVSLGESRD